MGRQYHGMSGWVRRPHDQGRNGPSPNGQQPHYLAMSACRSTTEPAAGSRSGQGWCPVCASRASSYVTSTYQCRDCGAGSFSDKWGLWSFASRPNSEVCVNLFSLGRLMAPVDVAFCSCAASLERRNASLTHSNGDVSSGSGRNTSARLSGYDKHLVSAMPFAADHFFIEAARSGDKDMQRRVDITRGVC